MEGLNHDMCTEQIDGVDNFLNFSILSQGCKMQQMS